MAREKKPIHKVQMMEGKRNVKPERKSLKLMNTVGHLRNPPIEVKMDVIHCCFEPGESVKLVLEDISYTSASIYSWRKKYLHRGITALMNDKNVKPILLMEGFPSTASAPSLLNYRLRSEIWRSRF